MRKNGMFSFAIMLIGAILMAACGQAATPTANASAPAVATPAPLATAIPKTTDANSSSVATSNCSIVSKDEIGTVLGEVIVDAREKGNGTICAYQTANLILEINFLNTGGFTPEQYMQNIRSINENGVSITGLGDDAFNTAKPAYPILHVRKGNSVFTFGLRNVTADQSLSSPDNAQALEKSVAELLISRLP
jgi:hypothetical protein